MDFTTRVKPVTRNSKVVGRDTEITTLLELI